MKNIIFACFFLFSPMIMAKNVIINCASTNITQNYSTSSPFLAFNQVQSSYAPQLWVINGSSGRICVNTVTASTSVAPTAGDGNEHCLQGNMFAIYQPTDLNLGLANIYVRADAANCTSGYVDLDLF